MAQTQHTQKQILLVDDHPIVRHGIALYINQEPDLIVCGQSESGEHALTLLEEQRPDLVVLDLELKGLQGIELIKTLRKLYEDLPILVLSMHDEVLFAPRVLRAGARGYIMKQEAPDQVLRAIRKVLQGGLYVSEAMSDTIMRLYAGGTATRPQTPIEMLSDRELEVFRLLGQGYQTRYISEALMLSPKTIEVYKGRLKDKLNVRSAAELVHYATSWLQAEGFR